ADEELNAGLLRNDATNGELQIEGVAARKSRRQRLRYEDFDPRLGWPRMQAERVGESLQGGDRSRRVPKAEHDGRREHHGTEPEGEPTAAAWNQRGEVVALGHSLRAMDGGATEPVRDAAIGSGFVAEEGNRRTEGIVEPGKAVFQIESDGQRIGAQAKGWANAAEPDDARKHERARERETAREGAEVQPGIERTGREQRRRERSNEREQPGGAGHRLSKLAESREPRRQRHAFTRRTQHDGHGSPSGRGNSPRYLCQKLPRVQRGSCNGR